MNDIMRDITAVGMAIIGVALLTVLVSKQNQTAQVIGAAAQGFGSVLSVSMGAAPNSGMGLSSF